jgi:hypothetical protein
MDGISLRIFTTERQNHNGILFYEWLLEKARSLGIYGGSAFRAVAGYGRHGKLREEGCPKLTPGPARGSHISAAARGNGPAHGRDRRGAPVVVQREEWSVDLRPDEGEGISADC